MPRPKLTTKKFTFPLNPGDIKRAQSLAQREQISLAGWLRRAIRSAVEAHDDARREAAQR